MVWVVGGFKGSVLRVQGHSVEGFQVDSYA